MKACVALGYKCCAVQTKVRQEGFKKVSRRFQEVCRDLNLWKAFRFATQPFTAKQIPVLLGIGLQHKLVASSEQCIALHKKHKQYIVLATDASK